MQVTMVVPSEKKSEIFSLVVEEFEEKPAGLEDHIGPAMEEFSGLKTEKDEANSEVDSNQYQVGSSHVPLLHKVLRTDLPPLAQPEDEEQLEESEESDEEEQEQEEKEQTETEWNLHHKSGPDELSQAKRKISLEELDCDSKETFDVDTNDEEDEEELILSGNFVDTFSPRSEADCSSFLPPLTMNTPLKCLGSPPLPLVSSTPAVEGGRQVSVSLLPAPSTDSCTPMLPVYGSCGVARPDSPVLPPPSPSSAVEAPLSLPGLVSPGGSKAYDYLLKVLLVGDSDVGKQEILAGLEDGAVDSPYASSTGAAYKTTIILIDGKRVKLQLWDTSGQGRFCTIIRSYSRGAQGILLVYDITNRWSFEGMDRWVKEVEEHAPGIPKVLVGNRLHLAFNRQVEQEDAERYAERHHMGFYEVSPLVNFNITESFQELCRMALRRNGMERLWRSRQVTSLHELCCHAIVANTNVYGIDKLPLPDSIKANLKSYALTNATNTTVRPNYKSLKEARKKRSARPPDAVASKCVSVSRKSCVIS